MADDQTTQSTKIAELEKHQAVLDVKLDTITQSIVEIKTNHLVHINDQLVGMNKGILDLGITMNDKVNQIYAKITELNITSAKRETPVNLINKIIEYLVIAIIGAGLAILISK